MTKRKLGHEDRDTKRTHCNNHISTFTMTQSLSDIYDEDDPCRLNFDKAKAAIDKTNYRKAIDTATFGLDDLIKKQIALLDIRAKAFELVNDFDNGLKDAMQMIQLMPSTALGYLRCGDLYSTRCNHKQAYSIYKQGYHAISTSNPDRALLKRYYEREQSQLNRRVDFVGRLPFDLLPIIFEPFNSRDLLKLLDVSRTWRYRLSEECVSLWSAMKIDINFDSKWKRRIVHVAHQITQLHLSQVKDARFMEEIFIHMANNRFIKLQGLAIHGCAFKTDGEFLHALEQVNETLTKLDINDLREPHQFPRLPYEMIISNCRNLKTLCYQHRTFPTPIRRESLEGGELSCITVLAFEVDFIDGTDIDTILRFCPKIRTLKLKRCPIQAVLRLIPRYCHALENLSLNAPEIAKKGEEIAEIDSEQQHTLEEDPSWKPGDGIRYINVGNVDCVDHLIPIITTNGHSLELLSIHLGWTITTHSIHRSIEVLKQMETLNKLKKFTIMNCIGNNNMDLATILLQKSPQITHILFKECEYFETSSQSLFQAIMQFDHLEALHFREIAFVDTHAMVDMFRHFISKGANAKLKSIIFHNCPFLSDSLLVAVSQLVTLSDISIYTLFDAEITPGGFLQLCQNLRRHPFLKSLSLRCTDCATSEAIRCLQEIAPLRKLCLDGTTSFVKSDLDGFSDNVDIDF